MSFGISFIDKLEIKTFSLSGTFETEVTLGNLDWRMKIDTALKQHS